LNVIIPPLAKASANGVCAGNAALESTVAHTAGGHGTAAANHVDKGHRGDQVRVFALVDLIIHQAEQHAPAGAGHAAPTVRVLVLLGDVPLIRAKPRLLETTAPLAVLAADPSIHSYGCVLRDGNGSVRAIVEEKDCDPAQRAIATVNTGIIAADAARLRGWLAELRNDNAQREYLITDVFANAAAEGAPAAAIPCADANEAFGANDAWQLAQLERHYQLRRARALCTQGVRLADPARFDLRGELRCGSDVEIDVDAVFEGDVQLGDGVRIGPFCRIRDSQLAAGSEVRAHCDLDGVVTHGPCIIGPSARVRGPALNCRRRARRQLRRVKKTSRSAPIQRPTI
jgi:bifunctional UDP-N-acetylglucosamine pyrophosphorylase/glucosamine-1-phosphate N-acetyltransferase